MYLDASTIVLIVLFALLTGIVILAIRLYIIHENLLALEEWVFNAPAVCYICRRFEMGHDDLLLDAIVPGGFEQPDPHKPTVTEHGKNPLVLYIESMHHFTPARLVPLDAGER